MTTFLASYSEDGSVLNAMMGCVANSSVVKEILQQLLRFYRQWPTETVQTRVCSPGGALRSSVVRTSSGCSRRGSSRVGCPRIQIARAAATPATFPGSNMESTCRQGHWSPGLASRTVQSGAALQGAGQRRPQPKR
ncbi:unnamed protein product [Cladocopium goreaui]|uniref:Uncharacterized protein n=1 Tax=Cladocopium goreaui TaxID=2562237 RepID=A0A9P1BR74_9DINO|nr:unnamed protein product [Cladocopium goreaui]